MKPDFIKAAKTSDFSNKNIKTLRILGKPVALIALGHGKFQAIEAGCKHQNADLTTGKTEGFIVTCPRHGWKYDLRTGKCLYGGEASLRLYPCKVEGETIYVGMTPLSEGEIEHSSPSDFSII